MVLLVLPLRFIDGLVEIDIGAFRELWSWLFLPLRFIEGLMEIDLGAFRDLRSFLDSLLFEKY